MFFCCLALAALELYGKATLHGWKMLDMESKAPGLVSLTHMDIYVVLNTFLPTNMRRLCGGMAQQTLGINTNERPHIW